MAAPPSGINFEANHARFNTAGGHIGSYNTNIQNASHVHLYVTGTAAAGIAIPGSQAVVKREDPKYPECPKPSATFTGRSTALDTLDGYFFRERTVHRTRVFVLWGSAGTGKSEIALKFLQRSVLSRVSHVYRIDASSQSSVDSAFQLIASVARKEGGKTTEEGLAFLCALQEQWFLLLEDFDGKSFDLRPYLSKLNTPWGRVIITSRNTSVRQLATSEAHFISHCQCHVAEMDHEEGIELLLRTAQIPATGSQTDYEFAGAIVQELGFHAHSIVLGGTSIIQAEMSLQTFHQSLLRNRFLDLDTKLRQTVMAAFSEGYDQLSDQAKKLIRLCGHLSPNGVSKDMFRTAVKQIMTFKRTVPLTDDQASLHRELQDLLAPYQSAHCSWDETAFDALLHELRTNSMIRCQPGDATFSLPPMMGKWIQNPPSPRTQSLAALFIFISFPASQIPGQKDLLHRLHHLPHIEAVLENQDPKDLFVDAAAFFGQVYADNGQWDSAETLQAHVLTVRTEILGAEHPATAAATAACTRRMWEQGQWAKALVLMEQTVSQYESFVGEDNEVLLHLLHDLAMYYYELGRWEECEALYDSVLARRMRVLGTQHPDVVDTEFRLALVYLQLGHEGKAKDLIQSTSRRIKPLLHESHPLSLFIQACDAILNEDDEPKKEAASLSCWERTKDILGEIHPLTLDVMYLVPPGQRAAGHYQQAKDTAERMLELSTSIRGPRHPRTLEAAQALAMLDFSFGQVETCRARLASSVEIQKEVLGENHPDTLTGMARLGDALANLGQLVKAGEVHDRVLGSTRRRFGAQHPKTMESILSCSQVYQLQEMWSHAEPLQAQYVRWLEKEIESPGTVVKEENVLSGKAELVRIVSCQGRFAEAERMHEEVAARLRRLSSAGSNELLIQANCFLGMAYHARMQYQDAAVTLGQCVQDASAKFGDSHPSTLLPAAYLAKAWIDLGKIKEAEPLVDEVFESRQKIVGEDHPETIRAKRYQSQVYTVAGKWKESVPLGQEVLKSYQRLLGEDNTLVLRATRELGYAYMQAGRYDEAKELYSTLLQREERLLGWEHPETVATAQDAARILVIEGQWAVFAQKQRRVIDSRRRVFGPDHPYTLTSELLLSSTLARLCHFKQAEVIQDRVLQKASMSLGDVHPLTIEAKYQFAQNLMEQGRYPEAQQVLEPIYQLRDSTLGSTHLWTMEVQHRLGVVYNQTGHYSASTTLFQVAQNRENNLGNDHPDAWLSIDSLSECLVDKGEYSRAEQMISSILSNARRRYGSNHLIFWTLQATQVYLYMRTNRLDQASDLLRSLMDLMRGKFGETFPMVLGLMVWEASIYEAQGKTGVAAQVRARIEKLKKEAGIEAPTNEVTQQNPQPNFMNELGKMNGVDLLQLALKV